MPLFPETKREVYNKNPLEEVLCQFRFPPILKISTIAPADFQEKIRKSYPRYDELSSTPGPEIPAEVLNLIKGFNLPGIGELQSHKFATPDAGRSIVLTNNSLTISESNYKRWESFRAEILEIEGVFRKTYEPNFYERIGLRYRDRIVPGTHFEQGTHWSDLLSNELIPLMGRDDFRHHIKQYRGEALLELPDVKEGRVHIRWGLAATRNSKELSFIVDADFFSTFRTEVSHAVARLDQFNREAGNFFRWAITNRLREFMEPANLE